MSSDGLLGPRPRGGLTPRARLILGCVAAIAGGVLTLVALQSDWHRSICPGTSTIVPGGGSVRVGDRVSAYSGSDVAGWLVPVTLIAILLPAVALMLDRRLRALLLMITALFALTLIVGAFAAPGYSAVPPAEVRTSGAACREADTRARDVAFLGAVFVLAGVGLAAKPATIVPKLGLPERPPSEVEP